MTVLFLGGCFFLLLAIFGVQVAKFALRIEGGTPKQLPPERKPVLAQGPPWRVTGHRFITVEQGVEGVIMLDDGSVWQGYAIWWRNQYGQTAPAALSDFLYQYSQGVAQRIGRSGPPGVEPGPC